MNTVNQPGVRRASLVIALFLGSTLSVTGCASTEPVPAGFDMAAPQVNSRDPYEGFNRSMYGFNMGVDKYVLKPVSDSYKFITPSFMQTGVTNFFNNLKGINVVINDLLQGKLDQGASDTGRFLTNTTIGLLGLFDVASDMGMEQNVEDFGQTLAVWGVDQGPYLVLPILGPTTVRDGGAIIVDKAANPGTYVPGSGIIEGINERANAEGALNFIDEAALDPYVFTRESFLQYRNHLISDGKTDAAAFDMELDEALGDEAAVNTNGAKASKAETAKEAKAAKGGKSAVSKSSASGNKNSGAFDSMLAEFEQASAKMDEIDSRRLRRRRH